MKSFLRMFAAGILFGIMVSCVEKEKPSTTRPKRTDIVVYDTPEGLSRMIEPPAPVAAVRWSLVPVVPQSRDGFGPTDANFYAVLTLDSAQWPAWERGLVPSASPWDYYLMEEVAEKILPPQWLDSTVRDSLREGRRLTGIMYDLDSIPTKWGEKGSGIRHGNYLFLDIPLN